MLDAKVKNNFKTPWCPKSQHLLPATHILHACFISQIIIHQGEVDVF